ncbi:MAG: pyridoxamine 5'-phosphate oxidase family protein [Actinomycetota bacterium]|nr:pyridoxamine 5'-phosphate oxidase family protein [Actinomycetota bacterium]
MSTTTTDKRIDFHRETEGATTDAGMDKSRSFRLTSEGVWRAVSKASFAVLSYVTPAGEPRSSGVVYKTVAGRLYVAVSPDSWKARHITSSGQVAVTVTVRRGGFLSLVLPIPPATISFHGSAIVHPAGSPQLRSLLRELVPLLPTERRDSSSVIEVVPKGVFVTYGVGVSLAKMRDPSRARARLPVS